MSIYILVAMLIVSFVTLVSQVSTKSSRHMSRLKKKSKNKKQLQLTALKMEYLASQTFLNVHFGQLTTKLL